jgi:uncharacterized protein (DUF849 family)
MENEIIVTCAVTGSIHTPMMRRYLPLPRGTGDDDFLASLRAGFQDAL